MLYFSRTDKGNIRKNNEDSLYIKEYNDLLILAICDGMGGHKSGEVASNMAVKAVESWKPQKDEDILKSLKKLVEDININIYLKSKSSDDLSGMGTTLSIAVIKKTTLYYAHVGDSRIYIYDGELKQITNDHTLTAELIKKGVDIKEERYSNYITRAVGVSSIETPDLGEIKPGLPFKVFLCTDGVTKYLCDQELEEELKNDNDSEIVNIIVDKCLERGGKDNITCILTKIGE
ncbi:protein phosphatase 2C domain-containing protein [uncultured Ezakiella sp.]|uniref:protein phosphatase 2C domain-containing protein n=1 Tax=uncultured Ezakiella sp. TaxID=1637529 RepID=UPI0025E1D78B|nr:protein phosphatase 2C domain-containing protein [uncultured Ezakiella sp.]